MKREKGDGHPKSRFAKIPDYALDELCLENAHMLQVDRHWQMNLYIPLSDKYGTRSVSKASSRKSVKDSMS